MTKLLPASTVLAASRRRGVDGSHACTAGRRLHFAALSAAGLDFKPFGCMQSIIPIGQFSV
jgi:hypothetical protein